MTARVGPDGFADFCLVTVLLSRVERAITLLDRMVNRFGLPYTPGSENVSRSLDVELSACQRGRGWEIR